MKENEIYHQYYQHHQYHQYQLQQEDDQTYLNLGMIRINNETVNMASDRGIKAILNTLF